MNHIPMTPVNGSSSIDAHGYDHSTNTLAVQFKSGATYHYSGVPQPVAHRLHAAKSAGGYVQSEIVGKYKHKVVG